MKEPLELSLSGLPELEEGKATSFPRSLPDWLLCIGACGRPSSCIDGDVLFHHYHMLIREELKLVGRAVHFKCFLQYHLSDRTKSKGARDHRSR